MMGGKHRKGHKSRKTRKTRKLRKGGAGYGFGAPVTVGTLEVVPNSTSTPYSSSTGGPIADPYATNGNSSTLMGGKRRVSRTRKGKSKKSRKSRSRKMRGGGGEYNVSGVRAEFTGGLSGVPNGTYGTYTAAASRVGGYGPTAGPDGVMPSA